MRYLQAGLGIVGLVALACGGQSRANEHAGGGGTGASEAIATGGAAGASKGSASGSSAGGNSAGDTTSSGASPSGGAGSAGTATGGVESSGGSNVTEAGRGGIASLPDGGAGGAPDRSYPNPKPSVGCGKDATQATGEFVKFTIQTSGTKDVGCADKLGDGTPNCGAWSYPRDYYVWLPPNYDKLRAYPLVLQAPGCGGNGVSVYTLSGNGGPGVNGSVIRVGLTPPPNAVGHATNPNQGCFDDREGDDSVDWPFYEALIDKLKTELCYDENRVFASGNSSGARFANELGCKYAGNPNGYAIRGVAVNSGGLPTDPASTPTCSNKPLSGMWLDQVGNTTAPFATGNKLAIDRAMQVNGCNAAGYDTADSIDYPIGGGAAPDTCKKLLGCPEAYPLVVCLLPGGGHGTGLDNIANPGFATYIRSLELP